IIINLPAALARDTLTTLTIVCSGRLESQGADRETIAVGQDGPIEPAFTAEPHYLYSNRSFWYPQAATPDYATVTLKITLPVGYDCVASGELQPSWPQVVGTKEEQTERKV